MGNSNAIRRKPITNALATSGGRNLKRTDIVFSRTTLKLPGVWRRKMAIPVPQLWRIVAPPDLL
jgi:hypothetical protein